MPAIAGPLGGVNQADVASAFAFDPGQSGNPKATHQYCVEHTGPLIKERTFAVSRSLAVGPSVAGPLGGAAQSGGFRTTDLDNNGAYLVEPRPGDPSSTLHSHAPAFPWPIQVADPITAHEGKTYTQEGKNNFRLHNVVPDAVIGFQSNLGSQGGDVFYGVSPTVRIGSSGDNKGNPPAVAAPSLTASNDPSRSPQSSEVTQQVAAVHASSMAVRRLTPRECERLQGFPDDWTLITYRGKPASDGPRYKALGNSMAVNVMRWLGARIALHG